MQDLVAAAYTGQEVSPYAGWPNTLMVKRAIPEQAAWSTLEPASVSLIQAYDQQVQTYEQAQVVAQAPAPSPTD